MHERTSLSFVSDSGRLLKVDETALKRMRSFIQWGNSDHESGGVLLGRFIKETFDVIIDEVTIPQQLDESTPTRFYRNQKEHQIIIQQIWEESEGSCNYLGEWHTHPEDYPRPSVIDLQNWRRLAAETKQGFDDLFFLIIGRKTISAYHASKLSLTITELNVKN